MSTSDTTKLHLFSGVLGHGRCLERRQDERIVQVVWDELDLINGHDVEKAGTLNPKNNDFLVNRTSSPVVGSRQAATARPLGFSLYRCGCLISKPVLLTYG